MKDNKVFDYNGLANLNLEKIEMLEEKSIHWNNAVEAGKVVGGFVAECAVPLVLGKAGKACKKLGPAAAKKFKVIFKLVK